MLEPVRIAGSVPMLMMMADDRQHIAERLERAADGFADDGMLPHDVPLFRSQGGAFLEDFVRDGDFSKVMQVAAALQGNDAVAVETELLAEVGGVVRQTLAVIAGIRVACFHA